MSLSVHDNLVYAHAVDFGRNRLVLHTVFADVEPHEFTDVVFEGVVTYHFEQEQMDGAQSLDNILFDVLEADPAFILEGYADLLTQLKNHAWPVREYNDLADLVRQLTTNGMKCFRVMSSAGLDGFVFATRMVFRHRASKADPTALPVDYTADRDELFAGMTVDDIAAAIRKEKDAPNPPPVLPEG